MKARLGYTALALGSALWLSLQLDAIRRANAPASDWFSVRSIVVEDATAATVMIDYDRQIKLPFHGRYFAVLRRIDGATEDIECEGSGGAPYQPIDGKIRRFLAWWMGKAPCLPSPGRYRLDTSWIIEADGYPPKEVRASSNVFTLRAD